MRRLFDGLVQPGSLRTYRLPPPRAGWREVWRSSRTPRSKARLELCTQRGERVCPCYALLETTRNRDPLGAVNLLCDMQRVARDRIYLQRGRRDVRDTEVNAKVTPRGSLDPQRVR